MGTWALIQVVFDIFAALGFFVIIMRMSRPPKDDPRLSRGLQLLQSKISVLEDLSDRTEVQVNQLISILDQKLREVQAKIQLADQHVHAIRVSMERSLEVAKIFQDKIPHQEIIERQNTIKYVQAARLAHRGLSVDEIAAQVDLPKGEIEFIAKVNRERLMFNEEDLPEWAKVEPGEEKSPSENASSLAVEGKLGHLSFDESSEQSRLRMELEEKKRLVENLSRLQAEMQNLDMQLTREASARNFEAAFEVPKVETEHMKKLGEEFRKACQDVANRQNRPSLFTPLEQLTSLIPKIFDENIQAEIQQAKPQEEPVQAQQANNETPEIAAESSHSHAKAQPQAQQAAAQNRASVKDPQAARAKVQAALEKMKSEKTQPAAPQVSPELEAARVLANEMAKTEAPQAQPKAKTEPEIRTVRFPRIDLP